MPGSPELSASTTRSDVGTGDSILKILVTTDNHLGYGEKDTIRGEDSFTAFEASLQNSVSTI